MAHAVANDLRSFSQLVEFESSRSLDLLNAIDDVVYAARALRTTLESLIGQAAEFMQYLQRENGPIDSDGSILSRLCVSQEKFSESYDYLLSLRASTIVTTAGPEDEDGILEAYDDVLDSLSAAQNALNELNWALREREADRQAPLEGEFGSVDSLFAAMSRSA